jgi:very-short-patch-repair endonuclease
MICKCGCGLETKAKCGFYKGHWNKGRKRPDLLKRNLENNCWKDPNVSRKAWETRRKKGYVVWNKNLFYEIDNRVKDYTDKRNKNLDVISKKISETKKKKYKEGTIISYWKGKKRPAFSQETRNNMSNSHKGKILKEETKQKQRISTIERIIKQGTNICFNEKSIPFFENLNRIYKLDGVYGKNEFKYLGYSLDFYSEKYNLVIEWDEKRHYKNNELSEKDKKRQENIINSLNCKFIRIKESQINKFDFNIIKKIIDEKK